MGDFRATIKRLKQKVRYDCGNTYKNEQNAHLGATAVNPAGETVSPDSNVLPHVLFQDGGTLMDVDSGQSGHAINVADCTLFEDRLGDGSESSSVVKCVPITDGYGSRASSFKDTRDSGPPSKNVSVYVSIKT